MAKNRKTPDMNLPVWFDGQNINEALFCEEFLQERRIIFANGAFFTPDGRVTDDLPLRGEIYDKLKFCAVNNIPRKITNILEVLKLEAQVPDFPPEQDRIHVANGMKKHGHYCKVCGEYKANEKFSGKGHASHICKSCASLPAEKQAELMTLNRLLNLPWRLSKEQLSWLKNRLKDRRPDVRALAQEQYEMRFPPRHLEDDEFNFFDEESFIE